MNKKNELRKTIYNPVEAQQIIPNMQEPIITENVWERVQELRQNKRRNTATNRVSLFGGLVFCADCGAKLHFCAAKSLRKDEKLRRTGEGESVEKSVIFSREDAVK